MLRAGHVFEPVARPTTTATESRMEPAFAATVPAETVPAGSPPPGMVWIPGGEFSMGAADPRGLEHGGPDPMGDARPIHRVYVDPFWMDATEVTNEEFAKFVRATGYVTVAERKPTREEFPTAPEENLKAGSVVFTPPAGEVPLDDHYRWWSYVPGASWRHPKVRAPTCGDARTNPWYTSPTKTPSPTPAGLASACPQRPSGSSRRAAA